MSLKIRSKVVKITCASLAVLVAVYLGLSIYGAKQAMVIPRLPLVASASSLGVPWEDASFSSRGDNLALKGWFLPGNNSRAIIVVHGGFQNRIDENADTPGLARALVGRGYNVLLFDLRGRGASDGDGLSLSHIDEDIGGAVDYLKDRGFAVGNICVLGFCSGAMMSCLYGSRHDVGALILDGCFIDCGTMVVRQGESINIPGWLTRFFIPGGTFFSWAIYGFHRIDPIDVIPSIKCPVLFLHEEFDPFTTTAETQRMFAASPSPASGFHEFSGSLHSQGFVDHPAEYIDAVDGFLAGLP